MLPLPAQRRHEARSVTQHRRQAHRDAQQVAQVVVEDGRERQHLHRVAVDDAVGGDGRARQRAPGDAQLALAMQLGIVLRALGEERGARRHQQDAADHPRQPERAAQAEVLAQQQHGDQRGQQRPAAARDRIHHRHVRGAIAGEQRVEVGQMHDGAGDGRGPGLPAPVGQLVEAEEAHHRQPQQRHADRGHAGEMMIALRLLGGEVPQRVDQRRGDDQGQRGSRHLSGSSALNTSSGPGGCREESSSRSPRWTCASRRAS
ncbi:hypothetical protein Ddc_22274 [Ditylenchus destructor]|nr:hypothetical protein Ddc_22274 [Ditylenchus destructor]